MKSPEYIARPTVCGGLWLEHGGTKNVSCGMGLFKIRTH